MAAIPGKFGRSTLTPAGAGFGKNWLDMHGNKTGISLNVWLTECLFSHFPSYSRRLVNLVVQYAKWGEIKSERLQRVERFKKKEEKENYDGFTVAKLQMVIIVFIVLYSSEA